MQESQYKSKIESLKNKIKTLQNEVNDQKLKHLQNTKGTRDWRAEYEKSEIKYYRLTLKLQKLEKEAT